MLFALMACGGGEPTSTAFDAVDWGYRGPGALGNWAALSEDYATCAAGRQQSPVDIAGYQTGGAAPISFSYGSDATMLRNDGKSVHIDYEPGGTAAIGQRTFELKSAHLHSPSEHWIDGAGFAAELHLVHADDLGQLVVVAQLFRQGEPSPIVQALLDAAPAVGAAATPGVGLNAGGYAPDELGYYRYDGSKTTPPCHEPVGWYVMRGLKTISPEQVDNLQALSSGPNNRPLQPIGSRVITTGGAP